MRGDTSQSRRQVAVIGAGAAGLCAAKHLLGQGIDVVIHELGSHIGGLWVYENDNGLSPAYQSLHVNSEIAVTAYKDFPFPPSAPLYPDHREMAAYLQAYADHFNLRPHTRFNSRVTSVRPADGGGWDVTLAQGCTERFDAVVVASGHQGVPSHPPFAKDFTGQYLHSHGYREPEPFKGQHVLVVVRPACPGLYFLGFFNVSGGGNIRMMDDQAEWVAAIESGRVALPEPADMTRAIAADREDKIKRYPDSPRYGLELDPCDYRAGLSREMRQGMKLPPA